MRTLTLTLAVFALVSFGEAAFAQPDVRAVIKAMPIEKVLDVNPSPDGKAAYRIDLALMDGTQVAYEISAPEAANIADGLSKPLIVENQNRQFANVVRGINVQISSKGEDFFLILTPHSRSRALASLAIPISGADLLVTTIQTKIAEAKTAAAKQRK